ncbi:unnamed protein product [Darwinula stevensoni]|uniref:3-hydroxyacyl-CoA dehydrogenase n=1 Tax=Darwinula stevensoni TaxID=69355 RepID=A0A7R8X683_9CRUS|nr:unnamed protein product [Darwinula stevensoni]CAG0887875.1 unnamed protein product [Darwinula stevensoni]
MIVKSGEKAEVSLMREVKRRQWTLSMSAALALHSPYTPWQGNVPSLPRSRQAAAVVSLRSSAMASHPTGKVAIVGSGLIGRSWAMLFASAGYRVCLYDVDGEQVPKALLDIQVQLEEIDNAGLLRGDLNKNQQFQLISGNTNLEDAVKGAIYVQECVPENLELKRKVLTRLDELVDGERCIVASSTSSIVPSKLTQGLKKKARMIVAHPVNPPYYVPLVEIVPAPWTHPDVTQQVRDIMIQIGQKPVVLKKEKDGFVLNRIQYAIITECWRLMEEGILEPSEIDTVMSEGLGMRYAFLGPLETAHLNAQGMGEYCEKYGEMILRVAKDFGPVPSMKGETLEMVTKDLERRVPISSLPQRRGWRDKCLMALASIKNTQP